MNAYTKQHKQNKNVNKRVDAIRSASVEALQTDVKGLADSTVELGSGGREDGGAHGGSHRASGPASGGRDCVTAWLSDASSIGLREIWTTPANRSARSRSRPCSCRWASARCSGRLFLRG